MFGLFDFGNSADTIINIAGRNYDYSDPAQKLEIMGLTAGLGIAVVFGVLIVIFLVLNIFNGAYFFKNRSAKAPEEPAAPEKSNDEEIVALTAAIYSYLEAEEPGAKTKYKVVSFRKR